MANKWSAMLFIVHWLSVTALTFADDLRAVEASLATARETHESEMDGIRSEVATLVESKVTAEASRDNPDLAKIDVLRAELKSLESGVFPKWISAKHKRLISEANRKLIAALVQTKRSYTLAKEYDKARMIDNEITERSANTEKILDRDVKKPKSSRDWRPLFNGKDLEGFSVVRGSKECWSVENGVLIARGAGWREMSFLVLDHDVDDFAMRFDFMVTENSDSGVLLNGDVADDASFLDVNIRQFAGESRSLMAALLWSKSGRAEDALFPSQDVEMRPVGEWNSMEVESRNGQIKVAVNGRDVLNADLEQLKNMPNPKSGVTRRSGRLGFQAHTGVVKFRDIMIKQ